MLLLVARSDGFDGAAIDRRGHGALAHCLQFGEIAADNLVGVLTSVWILPLLVSSAPQVLIGLKKLEANPAALAADLDAHWEVGPCCQ